MHDDYSLLRRFAERRDQAAFTELVDRYVNFAYNIALRRANDDAPVAAEATQNVFAALARQAGSLTPDVVLASWLHTATRSAVAKLRPAESRRQPPGKAKSGEGSSADWETVRPLLDDAVDELLESDRAPLVLRFFRRLTTAEIGTVLAISEDAARMRVERALERLRTVLAKRGVTATSAGLAATMTAGQAFPAPDGLAATIAAQSGAADSGPSAGSLRSLLTVKVLAAAVVGAGIGFFAGTRFAHAPAPAPASEAPTVAALRDDNNRLKAQVSALSAEVDRLKVAATPATPRRVAPVESPPPRQNAVPAEPAPMAATDNVPDAATKADAAADAHFQELKRKIEPAIERAIAAYRAAHQGNNPTSAQDVLPYFSTPQEGADFIEYAEASKHAP